MKREQYPHTQNYKQAVSAKTTTYKKNAASQRHLSGEKGSKQLKSPKVLIVLSEKPHKNIQGYTKLRLKSNLNQHAGEMGIQADHY